MRGVEFKMPAPAGADNSGRSDCAPTHGYVYAAVYVARKDLIPARIFKIRPSGAWTRLRSGLISLKGQISSFGERTRSLRTEITNWLARPAQETSIIKYVLQKTDEIADYSSQ